LNDLNNSNTTPEHSNEVEDGNVSSVKGKKRKKEEIRLV
jgi:hypothetical protein